MAQTKPQIRKALIAPGVVMKAAKAQQRISPIFFMENALRFDLLADSITAGQKQRVLIHLNGIIADSIHQDIELHQDFINLINELKG